MYWPERGHERSVCFGRQVHTDKPALVETRYQECELPPTSARYVKLKILSSYHFNAWAHVPQVRLLGRLGQ